MRSATWRSPCARSARANHGRIETDADDARRHGCLGQQRNERAARAARRERERRPARIVPHDRTASVRAERHELQADEKRDLHIRNRVARTQIDAPHDQALGALFREQSDVGAVEPHLLHGVATPSLDHVEAFLRAERHVDIVRFEAISRRWREAPAYERAQMRRIERPRRAVLSRNDHLGRIDVVHRKIDGRTGVRVEAHRRGLPRHVDVAGEEREVRIPLMFVEKRARRPNRRRYGAREGERRQRSRAARARTMRRNKGCPARSAARGSPPCNRDFPQL
jgi:hypothetical protein